MLTTRACEVCEKEFTREQRKGRPTRCCSAQCADTLGARLREKRVEVACDYCGVQVRKKASEYLKTTKHFCNMACMSKWQSENWVGENNPNGTYNSVDCTCTICGKKYLRNSAYVRSGGGKFCSYKCFGVWHSQNKSGSASPHWRGGKPPHRGANWKKQRDDARGRDKYRCQNCGIHEGKLGCKLDVHHIVAFHSFATYEEANQLTNLICLCRSCHKKAEYGRILIRPKLL